MVPVDVDGQICHFCSQVFVRVGGSVWVMGEWSVSQWILGVMRFQKIFGLYGLGEAESRNFSTIPLKESGLFVDQ